MQREIKPIDEKLKWDIIINIEPIPQERPRFTVCYKKGRACGRVYETQKMKEYKKLIGWEIKKQFTRPFFSKDIPVGVHIEFWLNDTRADIDNLAKVILDVMQGIVYENDRQVEYLIISKKKDKNSRINIFVWKETNI